MRYHQREDDHAAKSVFPAVKELFKIKEPLGQALRLSEPSSTAPRVSISSFPAQLSNRFTNQLDLALRYSLRLSSSASPSKAMAVPQICNPFATICKSLKRKIFLPVFEDFGGIEGRPGRITCSLMLTCFSPETSTNGYAVNFRHQLLSWTASQLRLVRGLR